MQKVKHGAAGLRPALALAATLMAGLAPLGAQAEIVFAISEGSSGSGTAATDADMARRYKPVVDTIERVLQERVAVKYVRDLPLLAEGIKAGRYDLVMARPTDYAARGVRDHGYSAVATSLPDGHCYMVVNADSPLKTLADAKGKRFILPEEAAYMTRFCLAELRDKGMPLGAGDKTFVREQGAIPFSIKSNMVPVGGFSSYASAAGQLDKEGLRLLHKSRPQPHMPLIAGKKIQPPQVKQLGDELVAMAKTDAGGKALAAVGIQGFDTQPQKRLFELLDWLDKK
ncbi:phosphate/phosphite/phosphonate ABC transporter substrate-binding protein [Ottowia testudinis]|uniref:PhnD/SsuA/transferrin family substrate-binding protein n=1 Tax=Ottowia testudinis TaxID=2816950 RepID=A0A975CHC1_9BURK|nr:PhnD/SsuA/transferrin family substrate-binding protein [Ottowia testudinis]QTD45594.1 PhnD/SsuA/transferrin family substrate-binding protein [Ottowia testudinis]